MLAINGRENIIPKEKEEVKKPVTEEEEEEEEDAEDTQEYEFDTQPPPMDQIPAVQQKKRLQKVPGGSDGLYDSDDDVVFDESQNIDKTKARNQFVADEAEENDSDDDDKFDDVIESTEKNNQKETDQDAVPEGDAQNNEGVQFDTTMDDDYDDLDMNEHRGMTQVAALPEPQAPFAPSSTPLARRRILCWNHHGVITSRERDEIDGTYRTIDFAFVDSATHRPVSFRDPYNFIIGTIGDEGGLFASDLMEDVDDDDIADDLLNDMSDTIKARVKKSGRKHGMKSDRATGSNIYFHRFDTFGSVKDKDWHLALPEGELVQGCASGQGWNAVVTSRRFLRMFSSGGLQGPIIWLKGNPVTLVGRGRFVAVIYHEGNPLMDGTQRLGYAMYDGVTGKLIVEGSVAAISPESSLTWAGFTNDLSLCVMDEDGVASMLIASTIESVMQTTYRWVPMLDTMGLKKSREDSFWPVTIQDGKLICMPLKGVKHPDAARRPLTTAFPLRMPLARGNGGRR